MTDLEIAARFEALFGRGWKLALDHSGLIPGASIKDRDSGQIYPEHILAILEFLETTPMAQWPARWIGLGKSSERCPTLGVPRIAQDLVAGRVRRDDAVLLWDFRRPNDLDNAPIQRLAVGLLPKLGFAGFSQDHLERRRWRIWMKQWDNAHGAPLMAVQSMGSMPEGILASWIVRHDLKGAQLDQAINLLASKIHGFSVAMVREYADRYRVESDSDYYESPDDAE